MQFNSFIFILAFLPIFIVGYYALNKIHSMLGKLFIIAAGFVFYAYGGWEITLVLLASLGANLLCSFIISKVKFKKLFLIFDIIGNIGVLLLFKYFNFFITTVNTFAGTSFSLKHIILPLGISFFTFQQIMYVINVYRKDIEKVNVLDYLAFIMYFPKLVMGPLAEPVDIIAQINDKARKKLDWDNIACGLKVFSFGLFKKLIIADTFAGAVNWGFENVDATTSGDLFLIMVAYTFEIYFDFSGYTDMAMGISKMVNIDLPINFDSPYKALSVRDFWKRWHISLTQFFTKYVYIPMGGSKKGIFRTYLNTMIIFLISGIWHGANFTFILWGALHGAFSIFDRAIGKARDKVHIVVQWAGTFLVVSLLWLLFRAESIAQWGSMVKNMFSFKDMSLSDGILESFMIPEFKALFTLPVFSGIDGVVRGLGALIFLVFAFLICLIPNNNYRTMKNNNVVTLIFAVIGFVLGFLCLSGESTFVYNDF